MPLNSGKECLILEGFGDKICKLIDEKLKSFLDDGNILHEEATINSSSDLLTSDEEIQEIPTKTKAKKPIHTITCSSSTEDESVKIDPHRVNILKGDSAASLIEKHKSKTFSFATTTSSTTLISGSNFVSTTKKESEVTRNNRNSRKEYMPEIRSGPYALLITLLGNEIESGTEQVDAYMLKNELCEKAQEHCNSQFVSVG